MIYRWRNMGRNSQIMAISLVLWAVGEGLWKFTLQPLYLDQLGATPQQIGFILALEGFARLAVMLPAGFLADRFGSWYFLLPGWILGLAGVIFIALAHDLWVASLGFLLYGISASAYPVINLYVVQSIHADNTVEIRLKPQEVLTFMYALFWAGIIISPMVGGFLSEQFSIRTVLRISAVWYFLSILTLLRTKSYPAKSKYKRSVREETQQYVDLLRQRRNVIIYSIFALGFIMTLVGSRFVPKFLEDIHHYSEWQIGVLGSVMGLGAFFWNIQLGKQNAWRGFVLIIILTSLAFLIIPSTANWYGLIVAHFLLGSWDVMRPVSTSIVADHTQADQQGVAFGMVETLFGLGTFIAAVSAGILYDTSVFAPFIASLLLAPLILIAARWFVRSQYNAIS